MSPRYRQYRWPQDYEAVGQFLADNFEPGNLDGNWMRYRWDYMHTHPSLDRFELGRIGLWEDDGRLVAVANYEDTPGTAYLQFARGYRFLAGELVAHAEQALSSPAKAGGSALRVYAPEGVTEVAAALSERGFVQDGKHEATSSMHIGSRLIEAPLPAGFRVVSLAAADDLVRVNQVMWRGFNHQGEPPSDGLIGRALMQSGPRFRHDLNFVVIAPNGDYASYAGLWYDEVNRAACVEPLATDPAYRRLGLARAAVLAGIRRCADEGATVAYVGSEQPFYQAIGFQLVRRHLSWVKTTS